VENLCTIDFELPHILAAMQSDVVTEEAPTGRPAETQDGRGAPLLPELSSAAQSAQSLEVPVASDALEAQHEVPDPEASLSRARGEAASDGEATREAKLEPPADAPSAVVVDVPHEQASSDDGASESIEAVSSESCESAGTAEIARLHSKFLEASVPMETSSVPVDADAEEAEAAALPGPTELVTPQPVEPAEPAEPAKAERAERAEAVDTTAFTSLSASNLSDLTASPRLAALSGASTSSADEPTTKAAFEGLAESPIAEEERDRGSEPAAPGALSMPGVPDSDRAPEPALPVTAESQGGGCQEAKLPAQAPAPKRSKFHWQGQELEKIRPLSGQPLRVFCGVWNLHGKRAPADISAWVPKRPGHHIYAIGTCECERSAEMSWLWASKARWEQQVADHLGDDYIMAGSHNMSAIHVMVFIHRYLWRYCWDIKTGQVATGFANLLGNKGGTQVALRIGHTSFLFVNAHLAAHQKKMRERTQNLTRILADSPIRHAKVGDGVHDEYDRVFFMGDLNPRLDAKRDEVDEWLAAGNLSNCLERDQLLPLLRDNGDKAKGDHCPGMWPIFEEAPITFPPTYKFDAYTDFYDTSSKRRVPSWTDRILWKRDTCIWSVAYDSVRSLQSSDHRPVFGQFEVSTDLDEREGPPCPERTGLVSSVCCVQ